MEKYRSVVQGFISHSALWITRCIRDRSSQKIALNWFAINYHTHGFDPTMYQPIDLFLPDRWLRSA